MAENKKSFVLYADLLKSIEHLTNEEKGILFNHLLEYVNDKNPILDDRLILTAWKPIEIQLKRDLVKYEVIKEKRSIAGQKSAEIKKQNSTKSTSVESVEQTSTKSTVNVSVNDNVNVTVNDNDNDILLKKETKEYIPDFSEFKLYALEKEPNVNTTALKHKYDAWIENGWKNGNNSPIKNWKSSLLQTLIYIEKNEKSTSASNRNR